ncbi:MAG: trehalose-phosphatase [Actinomycetota bacterium]
MNAPTDAPRGAADPFELAALLGPATSRLVVLDFDGVLSHIVSEPDRATPVAGALEAVLVLARQTSVAVVSGRPTSDLQARLGPLPVTLAGAHGAEIFHTDQTVEHLVEATDFSERLDSVEHELRELVDAEPGWLVERKPTAVAVHHRLAAPDSVDELLPRVRAHLERSVPGDPPFAVLSGKAVLELRPATVDKGRALDLIAERTPRLSPLVLGDDVTDEDAFRAATARGGTGVLVSETPRDTAASHRLFDPNDVVTFLVALARTED